MKMTTHLASMQMMQKIGIATAAALLITACASVPPPVVQMAVSRAAVSNATRAGANEFAPVPLKIASDKMDSAEKAMTEKNYVQARDLAEEAEIDAKLALAATNAAKALKAADVVQEDSRVLRNEIDRKSK